MTKVSKAALTGKWLHAHEEDTPTEQVFRPADHPFPPSRGRSGFELKPDGSAIEIGIAPQDGAKVTPGRWRLDPGSKLKLDLGPGSSRELTVASVQANRLVVRK